MTRRRLPEIPASALRDYGSSERVHAVWRRLKADLGEVQSAPRSRLYWAWAPALSVILFGSGVFVGAHFIRPQALPRLSAEPPQVARPAAAAAPSVSEPEVPTPQAKAARSASHRAPSVGHPVGEELDFSVSDSTPYVKAQPAPVPEWQRLVESSDFVGARRALDQQGGFDVAMAHASASELMSLVDIARASGERGEAIRALRQVLAHPETPEAPLAAWTLGNLLDQSGDVPGAAQAFALYRRLSPTGDFAEDAAARQVDVALSQGNVELVTQLVEDYARDFPHGRRLGEFRRAREALVNRDHDAGAKPETNHEEADDDVDETQSEAPRTSPPPSP